MNARERKALKEKLNVISFKAVSDISKTAAIIRINENKSQINALKYQIINTCQTFYIYMAKLGLRVR